VSISFLSQREEDNFDRFRVDGFDMCETCFTTLYSIGATTLQNQKQAFRPGNRDWSMGIQAMLATSPKPALTPAYGRGITLTGLGIISPTLATRKTSSTRCSTIWMVPV